MFAIDIIISTGDGKVSVIVSVFLCGLPCHIMVSMFKYTVLCLRIIMGRLLCYSMTFDPHVCMYVRTRCNTRGVAKLLNVP